MRNEPKACGDLMHFQIGEYTTVDGICGVLGDEHPEWHTAQVEYFLANRKVRVTFEWKDNKQ